MRIAIIGYGKMGHIIEKIALERGHNIACAIDRFADGAGIFSPEEGFESEEFRSADVAIEFTTPATAEANIRKAWEAGVPVVCGTTGWDVEKLKIKNYELHHEGGKVVVRNEDGKAMLVWSSNFSVGVNVFFELNKWLAEQMQDKPQYVPSIEETHHIHKLDKPSGTAKTLAADIAAIYEMAMYDVRRDIPIESIREGEVPGTHVVTWDSPEDTIVITHIAKGREGFALGAVLAAERLIHNA